MTERFEQNEPIVSAETQATMPLDASDAGTNETVELSEVIEVGRHRIRWTKNNTAVFVDPNTVKPEGAQQPGYQPEQGLMVPALLPPGLIEVETTTTSKARGVVPMEHAAQFGALAAGGAMMPYQQPFPNYPVTNYQAGPGQMSPQVGYEVTPYAQPRAGRDQDEDADIDPRMFIPPELLAPRPRVNKGIVFLGIIAAGIAVGAPLMIASGDGQKAVDDCAKGNIIAASQNQKCFDEHFNDDFNMKNILKYPFLDSSKTEAKHE